MAKKGGAKNLMDNKYWAVGYKWCNNIHIIINIIILIVGAFLIYKYLQKERISTTTDAIIKSMENDKCKEGKVMVKDRRGSHEETKYECIVNVDYKDENGKSYSNQVTTDDKDHKVGDKIQVSYLNNDHNNVKFREPWMTYLFWGGLLFYIFTIIGTIVRVFYKDEEWAQFFISIGCLQDLFGR